MRLTSSKKVLGGGERQSSSCHQLAVGEGFVGDAGPKQTVEEFPFPEAAGEAVTELREVGLEVLAGDPVMHPSYDALGVGHQDMHPGELLSRFLEATQDNPLVLVGGEGGGIGGKTVGDDPGALRDAFYRLPLDLGGGDAPHHSHHRMGGAFLVNAHPHQHRAAAHRPPAPFPGPGGPEVAVVELHQAGQPVESVPGSHGAADLVGHEPGGLVADARHSTEGTNRYPRLLPGHEEDEPEPKDERGAGTLHHRACGG